ncbi:MAG: ShlB/FhaC/HecB family hemolysin secretion/activation protein, partial [Methylococcales bacterium]|nr:ShlB/FhaC/HecB family hemolysin secretion/activation protein [Methylococcales bacterium]
MKLKPLSRQIATIIVMSTGVAGIAFAVDVPTAGQIQDNLKTQKNVFKTKDADATQQKSPPKKKSVKAGGKKIKVNEFVIEGNSIFTKEELHPQVAEFEGTSMTLKEVYAVADKLTKFYRDAGYSLATAAVPAQKVAGGTIRLQISEGIVEKLTFNGNTKYTDDMLAYQLDQIAPGKAVKLSSLEREVLLLDGLPGLTARSLIKPGKEQGTVEVEFNTEESPYEGLILIDNAGSDAIGIWRTTANITSNNHFGIGD